MIKIKPAIDYLKKSSQYLKKTGKIPSGHGEALDKIAERLKLVEERLKIQERMPEEEMPSYDEETEDVYDMQERRDYIKKPSTPRDFAELSEQIDERVYDERRQKLTFPQKVISWVKEHKLYTLLIVAIVIIIYINFFAGEVTERWEFLQFLK